MAEHLLHLLGMAPALRASLAKVWRRSCSRIAGTSALAIVRSNALRTLRGSGHPPTAVVKTRPFSFQAGPLQDPTWDTSDGTQRATTFRDHSVTICDHESPPAVSPAPLCCLLLVGLGRFELPTS